MRHRSFLLFLPTILVSACSEAPLDPALELQSRTGVSASHTPAPSIHELGTLGGVYSSAAAINALGEIAGVSTTASGAVHLALWSPNGQIRDLGDLGGTDIRVSGINAKGEIVGTRRLPSGKYYGFLWSDATGVVELGDLGGSNAAFSIFISSPSAINDLSQVVGYSYNTAGQYRPFVWTQEEGMRELAIPGLSSALDINNAGQLTGQASNGQLSRFYLTGSREDLGSFGTYTYGSGITELGHVAARGGFPEQGIFQTLIWTPAGGLVNLPMVQGESNCSPADINNLDQVLGSCYGQGTLRTPFYWSAESGLQMLPTLGGTQTGVSALNDVGQAVGYSVTSSGATRAVLWTLPSASPANLIAGLTNLIGAAVDSGLLSAADAAPLLQKLQNAQEMIPAPVIAEARLAQRSEGRGTSSGAQGLVTAFINQTDAYVRTGRMPAGPARELVALASSLVEQLQE